MHARKRETMQRFSRPQAITKARLGGRRRRLGCAVRAAKWASSYMLFAPERGTTISAGDHMKLRSVLYGVAAVAGIAALPQQLTAQCGYTFKLGIGGFVNGCYSALISQLGEDAGAVSEQYFWAGTYTGSAGVNNDPTLAGTFMFNNDCGSAGTGTFAFCTGGFVKPTVAINSLSGELVLGLRFPDNTYGTGYWWDYSGIIGARNGSPAPPGLQDVLLQLTLGGQDVPGEFLFGWEDLNTGCTARNELNNDRYRMEDLGNGAMLNSVLADCSANALLGNSDDDYNDSYMRFSISGTGTPLEVTPEPVTMSLMGLGLTALGGMSLRRRKQQK
jgi:hypothetical protein